MNLYEVICETYPELKLEDFKDSIICLEDDGDGVQLIPPALAPPQPSAGPLKPHTCAQAPAARRRSGRAPGPN